MIRQMKDASVTDLAHGDIISTLDFFTVLEREFKNYGITFEHEDQIMGDFLRTEDAIRIAADALRSLSQVKMEKHGFTAMLSCHA